VEGIVDGCYYAVVEIKEELAMEKIMKLTCREFRVQSSTTTCTN